MNENVVIIGAGGHAKVIADIIIKNNDKLIGFLDDNIVKETKIIEEYRVIGKIEDAIKLQQVNKNLKFIIGIGDNETRKKIADKYNLSYYTAIHPSAVIGLNVEIEEGTTVMANSVINVNSKVGKHCIINTAVVVEHDNFIGDYVHLSPTTVLSGNVKVAELVHIGTGCKVKNNISINEKCVLGVGTVVVKDINESGIYVGVPARKIKEYN